MRTRESENGGTVEIPRKPTKRQEPSGGPVLDKVGTFQAALNIAKNGEFLEMAVTEHWASSRSKAREARRSFVRDLAQSVAREFWTPPLTGEVIVGVAAALKKAKLKSGAALLNDLKLWHVEEGYEIPEWMVRLLGLAKKSVERGTGPSKRAPELKLGSITSTTWRAARNFGNVNCPTRRVGEVQVEACERVLSGEDRVTDHPLLEDGSEGVGSKKNVGVLRENTVQPRVCLEYMAAHQGQRREAEPRGLRVRDVQGEGGQAGRNGGSLETRLGRGTVRTLGTRSGAMMYVRAGLPLQEMAFLGRWKSNVVLTYAEEALEEVPASRRMVSHGEEGRSGLNTPSGWLCSRVPAIGFKPSKV